MEKSLKHDIWGWFWIFASTWYTSTKYSEQDVEVSLDIPEGKETSEWELPENFNRPSCIHIVYYVLVIGGGCKTIHNPVLIDQKESSEQYAVWEEVHRWILYIESKLLRFSTHVRLENRIM